MLLTFIFAAFTTLPLMLTFGMFSIALGAFIGCVWWACQDDADGVQ